MLIILIEQEQIWVENESGWMKTAAMGQWAFVRRKRWMVFAEANELMKPLPLSKPLTTGFNGTQNQKQGSRQHSGWSHMEIRANSNVQNWHAFSHFKKTSKLACLWKTCTSERRLRQLDQLQCLIHWLQAFLNSVVGYLSRLILFFQIHPPCGSLN